MSEKKDYGQLFCGAVDEIIQQRLSELSFDLTKTCIITDDSEAQKGKYRVKMLDGTSEFYAYSIADTYKIKDTVYVQIPSGDMNEQKIIISKKLDDKGTPLSYQSPFETYLGITGNLISNSGGVIKGLTANEDLRLEKEDIKEGYINYENLIWAYVTSDEDMAKYFDETTGEYKCEVDLGDPLSKYSMLGIQAQFRSWLGDRYLVKGSYGLKLRIQAEAEDANEVIPNIDKPDSEETTTPETTYYEFTFDCADMVGDVYNFTSYYEQEQVFNIKDIYQIKKMELIFYQANNFRDKNNQLINYKDKEGNLIIPEDDPNLFVKDISISLGYDASEFDENQVFIYSLGSPKYTAAADNAEDNHRQLEVRWIHKDSEGKISVVKIDDDIDYKLTWYKYRLGTYSHHPKVGADWKPMSVQFSNKRFSLITTVGDSDHQDPDAFGKTEETKENKYQFNILDEEWLDYNNSAEVGYRREPGEDRTWLLPDVSLATESVKVLVSYLENPDEEASRKYLLSNTLDFSNRKDVVSKPTVDAVTALTIECVDGSNGNYLIYDQGNNLLDPSIGLQEKTFLAKFKGAELKNAEYIEWILPKDNSMIVIDDNYLGADFTDNKDAYKIKEFKEKIKNNEPNNEVDSNGFYHIYRFGDSEAKGNKYDITHANTQRYRIRSYYSSSYSNNTIQCKVRTKDGITYTATKQLLFGPSGTSGSDHTLIIEYDEPNINGITVLRENAPPLDSEDRKTFYNLRARLYNYEGQEIDFNSVNDYELTWEWYDTYYTTKEPGLKINKDKVEVPYKRTIDLTSSLNIHQLYILQVSLKWRGNETLVAYFPIALKRYITVKETDAFEKAGYSFIQGPDRIIYQSNGNPYYIKVPYSIYRTNYIKVEEKNPGQINSDYKQSDTYEIVSHKSSDKIDENHDKYIKIEWNMLYSITNNDVDNNENIEQFYPKLNFNQGKDEKSSYLLFPQPLYIKDTPLCGVQAKWAPYSVNKNTKEEQALTKTTMWTQPLLILMNRYPNGAVNRWDGKGLKFDEENGTVIGTAFAAGRKESDNTFSGVMLGDWEKGADGDAEESITQTGVYGFHHGEMSYALSEEGSMFIGKSGRGRIYFDGDHGTITSGNYKMDNETGMKIDLEEGSIDAYNFKLKSRALTIDSGISYNDENKDGVYTEGEKIYSGSKFEFKLDDDKSSFIIKASNKNVFYISSNSDGYSKYYLKDINDNMLIDLAEGHIKATKFLLEAGEDDDHKIIIDSDYLTNKYPLSIGKNFKVAWDGSLYANNAYLSGQLESETGLIGGWLIGKDTLSGVQSVAKQWDEENKKNKYTPTYAKPLIQLNSKYGAIIGGKLIASDTATDNTGRVMQLWGSLSICNPAIISENTEDGTLIITGGESVTGEGYENYFGYLKSNIPEVEDKAGIGFAITDGEKDIARIITTIINTGMSFGNINDTENPQGGYVSITSDGVHIDGKPNLIIGPGNDQAGGGLTLNGDKIMIGNWITLEKTGTGNNPNKITFNADPENQWGIYARFA